MTRDNLALKLRDTLSEDGIEVTHKQAYTAVDAFCDAIMQGVALDGRVELRGFGTFKTSKRRARTGRNPRTGEAVSVPAKKQVLFKPGIEMKAQVNGEG